MSLQRNIRKRRLRHRVTHKHLVVAVSKITGFHEKDIREVFMALRNIMEDTVLSGGSVSFGELVTMYPSVHQAGPVRRTSVGLFRVSARAHPKLRRKVANLRVTLEMAETMPMLRSDWINRLVAAFPETDEYYWRDLIGTDPLLQRDGGPAAKTVRHLISPNAVPPQDPEGHMTMMARDLTYDDMELDEAEFEDEDDEGLDALLNKLDDL